MSRGRSRTRISLLNGCFILLKESSPALAAVLATAVAAALAALAALAAVIAAAVCWFDHFVDCWQLLVEEVKCFSCSIFTFYQYQIVIVLPTLFWLTLIAHFPSGFNISTDVWVPLSTYLALHMTHTVDISQLHFSHPFTYPWYEFLLLSKHRAYWLLCWFLSWFLCWFLRWFLGWFLCWFLHWFICGAFG